MADTSKAKPRIGNFNAGLLIGFALLCDLVQFVLSFLHVIPVVGNALAFVLVLYVTIFAYLTLGIWFALCRVNYFTGKKAALKVLTLLATIGIELIPIIDAIPAITAGVITMIIVSRIEDVTGIKAKHMTTAHMQSSQKAIGAELLKVASPINKVGAVVRTAKQVLGQGNVPNDAQVAPTETKSERQKREERASQHPETQRALKEFQGFSNDAKQFNIDRIDPSFYGLKTERQRKDYEAWRRAKTMITSSTRKRNVDNIEQKPPEPNSYR